MQRDRMHWSSDQQAALLSCLMRWQSRCGHKQRQLLIHTWAKWREFDEKRKAQEAIKKKEEVREAALGILKGRGPGQRSEAECRVLGRWLQALSCVPRIEHKALMRLAVHVEVLQCKPNTLVILQGEFGNCYYMIAFGGVALYVEDNRDRELSNFRDFAQRRGEVLSTPKEALGRYVLTLSEGKGFGELAVIATTHKIRSASAVSVEDTCLLIVQGPVYLATIHPFSNTQERVGAAMALLKEHRIAQSLSFANVAALAYEMQKHTRQRREVVVRAGQPVNNLIFIRDGFVKAHDDRGVGASLLGHGCVIGESELYSGQSTFSLTYTADSMVEFYELPLDMYHKIVRHTHFESPKEMRMVMKPLNARQLRIEKGREQIEILSARKAESPQHQERAYTIASIVPLLRLPRNPKPTILTPRSQRSPNSPRNLRSPRTAKLSARNHDTKNSARMASTR